MINNFTIILLIDTGLFRELSTECINSYTNKNSYKKIEKLQKNKLNIFVNGKNYKTKQIFNRVDILTVYITKS